LADIKSDHRSVSCGFVPQFATLPRLSHWVRIGHERRSETSKTYSELHKHRRAILGLKQAARTALKRTFSDGRSRAG
jgi:hypothetical protein